MKLVLAGGYDTANLGDHAMLVVLAEGLRARGHAPEITLLSRHPSAEFDRTYGVRSIPNLDHASREAARGRFFRGLNRGDDTAHLAAIQGAIEEADLLVIGGGRMFLDIAFGVHRGPLPYFALLATLARFAGAPVALFAKTIVPLEREAACEHVRFLSDASQVVTVREEDSRDELASMGAEVDHVHVLPDPAWGLACVELEGGTGPPALSLPAGDGPLVAVNARSYRWRDGEGGEGEHRRALAASLDALVDELGARPVFVPQATYDVDGDHTDDRAVARDVAALMQRGDACAHVTEPLDVGAALALYARADLLVTERRHGAILAATRGTPVVALEREPNTGRALRELGEPEAALAGPPERGALLDRAATLLGQGETERTDRRRRAAALGERAAGHAELLAAAASPGAGG
jgi:polysaccharide pyruvyl transferase WcaK-like protein